MVNIKYLFNNDIQNSTGYVIIKYIKDEPN